MEFRDLKQQYEHFKNSIDEQISNVIQSSRFIAGSQIKTLEHTLASYVGVSHCISCANGTDAIEIALLAHGIGPGDAVFVPDFTFFSSGECPAAVGAAPIFVDVSQNTYNIDCESLERAVHKIQKEGELKPRAVIAVDLFGQPFDADAVRAVCDRYGMLLLEDAAQGFGGRYICRSGEVKKACALGSISTTSFFPAKPLGCYGDGGAIFTNDAETAQLVRSIAVHGKDMEHPDNPDAKYNNVRLGMNSRLDTLQAGILLAKFPGFRDEELEAVNRVAAAYAVLLGDIEGLVLPSVGEQYYSSWAQYTIQIPEGTDRSALQKALREQGIPTNIYYMKPMHKQRAFAGTRSAVADCPVTEKLCERVLCLPIHPYLEEEEIRFIAANIRDFFKS